jgi:hypothetical protein
MVFRLFSRKAPSPQAPLQSLRWQIDLDEAPATRQKHQALLVILPGDPMVRTDIRYIHGGTAEDDVWVDADGPIEESITREALWALVETSPLAGLTRDERRNLRRIDHLLNKEELVWREGILLCKSCGSNCGQCGTGDVIGTNYKDVAQGLKEIRPDI